MVVSGAALALAPLAGAKGRGQARRSPQVKILSPAQHARTTVRTLRARVRVTGGIRGFDVVIGNDDVTKRFGPAHDGVRTALLRRGRDYQRGRNYMFAQAGSGRRLAADQVMFVAQSPGPRLMTVSTPGRPGPRASYSIKYRLRQSVNALTVTFNGRRVRTGSVDRTAGRHRLSVGIGDGLRRGTNRVVITAARDTGGTFDRESRTFRVGAGVSLASAGSNVSTRPGSAVTLNARQVSAGAGNGKLVYRWQIVQRPPRSRALIENPTSRTAKLLPDIAGQYRVRLLVARATQASGAGSPGSASAPAAGPPAKPTKATCAPNLVPPTLGRTPGPATNPTTGTTSTTTAADTTSTTSTTSTATTTTSTTTGSGGSTGPFLKLIPVNPLTPPACVVPTGSTTPSLPAGASGISADLVDVNTNVNGAPIGNWIQTIASDGSIQVQAGSDGISRYPAAGAAPTPGAWAQLLVLNSTTLEPDSGGWGAGDQMITFSNAASLATKVAMIPSDDTVVISGMNVKQSGSANPAAALASLTTAVQTLGGTVPSDPNQRTTLILSGQWSIIGAPTHPASTFENLNGLSETPPPGSPAGSLPGSLDGYMQSILKAAPTYVPADYVPIDTRAAGSSNTVDVFKIGSTTYTSPAIAPGALGLHIVALGTQRPGPGGQMPRISGATVTLDKPGGATDLQGVAEAAQYLQTVRQYQQNALIVMQTFGSVPANTSPSASPAWVNDDLGGPDKNLNVQNQWYGQPLLKIAKGSTESATLDAFWNPPGTTGYPTVAGQVGDLTGAAGHDYVANLGVPDPGSQGAIAVTHLTMVAPNHPYATSQSYVDGYNSTAGSNPIQGRMVGTLTRDHQSQWIVSSPSQSPLFGGSQMWQIALGAPTSWPYTSPGRAPDGQDVTTAEAAQYRAAMATITKQLDPLGNETDLRATYVNNSHDFASWQTTVGGLSYQKTSKYTAAEFTTLQKQLGTELGDVAQISSLAGAWEHVYGAEGVPAIVNLTTIGDSVLANADLNSANAKKRAAGAIDPLAVISRVMGIAQGLISLTPAAPAAGVLGALSNGLGLIDMLSPPVAKGAGVSPDTDQIQTTADNVEATITDQLQQSSSELDQLRALFVSDWGKLRAASQEAAGPWSFSTASPAVKTIEQATLASAGGAMYQALLPLTYTEWVIAPYYTPFNPKGVPNGHAGNGYKCGRTYKASDGNYKQEHKRPFVKEPQGGVQQIPYRASVAPGATTLPAKPNTAPYVIRALKSTNDPLTMDKQTGEYGWPTHSSTGYDDHPTVTVDDDGANPPTTVINDLFAPLDPNDSPDAPTSLGMSKIAFYADFGGGATQSKRFICSHTVPG